jgi:hypothetical protein
MDVLECERRQYNLERAIGYYSNSLEALKKVCTYVECSDLWYLSH